jgi:predicted RNA-binding Zn-ribbon protein involved in translation (DUF1610 family)
MNSTEQFKTVLTFTYPSEMVVVRGRLEADGIECFVQDELTIQVNPFYSNAIGGVKLQVKESDYESAVEILRQRGYMDNDNQTTKMMKSDVQIMTCPSCGSAEVVKCKTAGYVFVFSFLLLGFPIPFLKKTYHCFECGIEFKKR